VLYGSLRKHLGEVFRRLAEQKESRIEEGHLQADDVHMMISIPPKYAVSQVVGFFKGKSAIHLARVYGERKQDYAGQSFWARGYFVSTVGRDEAVIREYIRDQEKEDQRMDQRNMWKWPATDKVAQLNRGRVSDPAQAASSGSQKEAPVVMSDILAAYLLAWRQQTTYSKAEDWIFASVRTKGATPRVGNMLVRDYLYPAAVKASVLTESQRHETWIDRKTGKA
jgi:putative transposase